MWLGPLADAGITKRVEKSAKNSLYISQKKEYKYMLPPRHYSFILSTLRLIPYNRHLYHKVPICAITMKNARSLAVALAAAFLPESTFALINDPMKPPNERFVLNVQQALIAVKAASAKAVTNKYSQTIPMNRNRLMLTFILTR